MKKTYKDFLSSKYIVYIWNYQKLVQRNFLDYQNKLKKCLIVLDLDPSHTNEIIIVYMSNNGIHYILI